MRKGVTSQYIEDIYESFRNQTVTYEEMRMKFYLDCLTSDSSFTVP